MGTRMIPPSKSLYHGSHIPVPSSVLGVGGVNGSPWKVPGGLTPQGCEPGLQLQQSKLQQQCQLSADSQGRYDTTSCSSPTAPQSPIIGHKSRNSASLPWVFEDLTSTFLDKYQEKSFLTTRFEDNGILSRKSDKKDTVPVVIRIEIIWRHI